MCVKGKEKRASMRVEAGTIGNINTFRVNSLKNLHASKPISFGDSFVPKPEVIFGEITPEETNEIIETVKNAKELSSGWTSAVYKFKDKIIKAPKDKIFDDKYFETLAKGQNLKEYFALSKIKDIDPSIATNPSGVIRNKDSYYLVEEFIKGKHPEGNPMTTSHLKDLTSKFFKLDTNGIFNCDLQPGNIFMTDKTKSKLIDFGSFSYIDNGGNIVGSDYIHPDIFKPNGEIFKETNLESSKKILKTFLTQDKFLDVKNLADNPYLNMPSNASNFELRTMYSHLLDGSEKNPLEFFKEYLKTKSKHYHTEMEKFLKGLDFKDIDPSDVGAEKIDLAKANLGKAVKYENLIKETLANSTDDVAKVELAKLQFRTFLNLGDSLNSPVENPKKLQSAYTQFVTALEDGIKTSDGNKKEYFTQTLNDFKNKFKDYPFEQGQVAIPENENLLKVLFKGTAEKVENVTEKVREVVEKSPSVAETVSEVTEKVSEAAEKVSGTVEETPKIADKVNQTVQKAAKKCAGGGGGGKPPILPIIAIIVTLTAITALAVKLIKKNKAKNIVPSVKNNLPNVNTNKNVSNAKTEAGNVYNNLLTNNVSDIFSSFKS